MHYPHSEAEVRHYIDTDVKAAFESVQVEFKRRYLKVMIEQIENGLALKVDHHNEVNFIYQVVARETLPPSFMPESSEENIRYFQAEVFLREGGQAYDVMDWTREDLLQDIIDQYERHLHFLSLVRMPEQSK